MEETFRRIFNLFLWMAAAIGLVFLGVKYFDLSETLYFIGIVVAIGCFSFFHRPFFQMRFSSSVDLGITIISGAILFIYLASLVVQPSIEQEQSLETCGTQTNEKKCYTLPKLVCQNMWEKYEGECIKEIKKDVGDRVTALIGPPIKKCTQRRFDKSLYYTRKSKDPDCQAYFQSIKE